MNIEYGKQLSLSELDNLSIQAFIMAGNHEDRVMTGYEQFKRKNSIKRTLLFRYKSDFEVDERFPEIESYDINAHTEVAAVLDDVLSSSNSDDPILVVDYSCMTKSWYYTIILYLKKKKLDQKRIRVYFTYTPSQYSEPLSPKPNTEMAPLPGKYRVPTNKPKALIVCLGYEQHKAAGIIDHLDPKVCYLLYSKPALDNRFVGKIEENNSRILKHRPAITFPLDDLGALENELTSLYYLLRDEYSIIIAPLGPKPFTLIAMLMTIRYPDIDIWRVGSGADINEYQREPINDKSFIINEVAFRQ